MSDRAYWLKECRGGYGFITRVPVVVLGRTRKRVRVLVPVRPQFQSAMGEAVVRLVASRKVVPRESYDGIDDIAAAQGSQR